MPDNTPLALPMLMQSGTTPQQPWVSSFPSQYGTPYLNELRRQYLAKKRRLAQLPVEQKLRQSLGAVANTGPGFANRMVGQLVTWLTPSDAQAALEIQRLQSEIKEMERQYPFLTEPNIQGANWEQLLAEKTQQDIQAGLLSPEEGLKLYTQAQSYLTGQTPPEAAPGTTWQQPGQPTTGAGQPTTDYLPYPARMLGMTQEDWDQAPAEFKRDALYYLIGVQPPQRFDPMQFFQERMAQSAENKRWREQMALAQRELDAQIANQQALRAMQQQQLAAEQAYQQQALAQAQAQFEAQLAAEQAYRQQQIEQARREMAAQIGINLNAQQSQNWAQALPYVLPYGTQTPPGFEAGGPVNALATMAGQQNYTPMQISPSPQPEMGEMEALIKRAIDAFK